MQDRYTGDIGDFGNSELQKSHSIVKEFQKAYPTRADKEAALRSMSNEEIDKLIDSCSNIQAKIFYASFKKK